MLVRLDSKIHCWVDSGVVELAPADLMGSVGLAGYGHISQSDLEVPQPAISDLDPERLENADCVVVVGLLNFGLAAVSSVENAAVGNVDY